MKFSVVVVAYNEQKRIRKCLNSIVSQTYSDYELILVNDGSEDNTLSIMKEYKEKYKNIRIIDKPNTGQADCKNIGIIESTGRYILFVDGDDFVSVNLLTITNEIIESKNVDLILYKFNMYFEKNGTSNDVNDFFNDNMFRSVKVLSLYLNNELGPIGRNMVIKRDILIENNIKFPLRTREDGGTIYKILMCVDYIYLSSNILYTYVRHDSSTVSTINPNNCTDVLTNLNELDHFLIENGIKKEVKKEYENYLFSALMSEYRQLIFSKISNKSDIYCKNNTIISTKIKEVDFKQLSKKNKVKFVLFYSKGLKFLYLIKSRFGL